MPSGSRSAWRCCWPAMFSKDKAARFHWRLLTALWNYAADCLPEIADDAASVDRAMRAGFNWEMGPFQLWDAAGVPETVARMQAGGRAGQRQRRTPAGCGRDSLVPRRWRGMLRSGERRLPAGPQSRRASPAWPISATRNGVVAANPGASLVDLGDGVACLELHSKKNAIGEDIVRLVTETLRAR